jgi:hypothetical protein
MSMTMKTPANTPQARIDRELAREREERHRHDEARAGIVTDDDLRQKDARERDDSGVLHRSRGR